ncbi:MAG: RluA family pseudouridine synthase [Bacteroidia bacterium]
MNWEEQIIYKDIHLMVVNKPFGMLAQKDKNEEKGVNELLFDYLGKPNFWLLLQRIDRVAGGLMSISKSRRVGNAMRELQLERKIEKTYYIITERVPEAPTGRIEQYIKKLPRTTRWKVFDEKVPNSKSAILEYQLIATINNRSLIKVKPITGRTHQIRSQMANIGCPVVGDKKYGKTKWLSDESICLFSAGVSFEHPISRKKIEVNAPLPVERAVWNDFKEVISKL